MLAHMLLLGVINMANLGLLPPGTIQSGGLGARPEGLPTEFNSPKPPRGWNPLNFIPQSPQERRQHEISPELHGRPVAGLLHSTVPGRTDQLPISVEPGSYVIPADVVSGMGQGNTTAGATLLSQILPQQARAKGGSIVPIVAAGGEYVVPPSVVKRVGRGDLRKGQDILDKMVRKIRITTAKQMMKLPGPRRD